jgi:hypothetical protein
MAHRIINRYSELSFDEINEPVNMKRKAEKKLREIESLKKRANHTPEEYDKIAREQEWLDILNPPPPTPHLSTEPAKQTNKQRKKEKEREAKKKRAEELRKQKEAREQKEQEQREKYQRDYQARQEELRRAWREQEERKQKEREELRRKQEEAKQKRDAALGKRYMNDPLAIELYTTFNTPLAIHLYTEYGQVKTQKESRIAFHRLSLKYHPDKTCGTTTEHQKIIGFIRDYLQDVLH